MRVFTRAKKYAKMNCILDTREKSLKKKNKTNEEVKLKMAEKKTWLMKFKSRISKLKLHKPKSECKENLKQNKLPDLITPTHEKINASQKQIQREEAIRVNLKDIEFNNLRIKDRPEKDVPDGRKRSNPNR